MNRSNSCKLLGGKNYENHPSNLYNKQAQSGPFKQTIKYEFKS